MDIQYVYVYCIHIYGCFLKWWCPTTMGFPTKHDHFGVFWRYHHLRKHPFIYIYIPSTMNHPMHLQGHLHCTAGAFRLGDSQIQVDAYRFDGQTPTSHHNKKKGCLYFTPDLVCRWHKPAKLRKIFIIDYRHDMIWYTLYMVRMLIPCRLYDHIQSHFCGMPTWGSEAMPNANPVMTRWNEYPRVSGFNLASSNWQILIL